MSLVRSRLLRRLSMMNRLADMLLVASIVIRLLQRKGLIGEWQANRAGFTRVDKADPIGATEIALAAAALYRLLRRRP